MKRIAISTVLLLCACGRPAEPPRGDSAVQDRSPPAADAPAPVKPPARAAGDAMPAQEVSPCLLQDGKRLPANAVRAIGTEPFWGVRVEGRCVTYSTPEDQDGTRVWTRFSGTAENGRWTGALDGRPFVMATRSEPGCSDGMSDNLYPIAVTLTVRGELRSGCAKPD